MNIEKIRALDPKRVIVLDTETTGLRPRGNDEILSLSIIDLEGTVLFDEIVKPAHRMTWKKAEEINGISPGMVKDKQPLSAYSEQLCDIWKHADLIVGYNVGFDTAFLYASEVPFPPNVEEFDVMREFAPIWGHWDGYHHDWRWPKLVQCAEHYGIGEFDAHSSLGDTEATRKCFLALIDDPAYIKACKSRKREGFAKWLGKANGRVSKSKVEPQGKHKWLTIAVLVLGVCAAIATLDHDAEPIERLGCIITAAACFAIYWYFLKPKRGDK